MLKLLLCVILATGSNIIASMQDDMSSNVDSPACPPGFLTFETAFGPSAPSSIQTEPLLVPNTTASLSTSMEMIPTPTAALTAPGLVPLPTSQMSSPPPSSILLESGAVVGVTSSPSPSLVEPEIVASEDSPECPPSPLLSESGVIISVPTTPTSSPSPSSILLELEAVVEETSSPAPTPVEPESVAIEDSPECPPSPLLTESGVIISVPTTPTSSPSPSSILLESGAVVEETSSPAPTPVEPESVAIEDSPECPPSPLLSESGVIISVPTTPTSSPSPSSILLESGAVGKETSPPIPTAVEPGTVAIEDSPECPPSPLLSESGVIISVPTTPTSNPSPSSILIESGAVARETLPPIPTAVEPETVDGEDSPECPPSPLLSESGVLIPVPTTPSLTVTESESIPSEPDCAPEFGETGTTGEISFPSPSLVETESVTSDDSPECPPSPLLSESGVIIPVPTTPSSDATAPTSGSIQMENSPESSYNVPTLPSTEITAPSTQTESNMIPSSPECPPGSLSFEAAGGSAPAPKTKLPPLSGTVPPPVMTTSNESKVLVKPCKTFDKDLYTIPGRLATDTFKLCVNPQMAGMVTGGTISESGSTVASTPEFHQYSYNSTIYYFGDRKLNQPIIITMERSGEVEGTDDRTTCNFLAMNGQNCSSCTYCGNEQFTADCTNLPSGLKTTTCEQCVPVVFPFYTEVFSKY